MDIDKTTDFLELEKPSKGGLHIPVKDRVTFNPPEKKSLLALDVLASAKRESKTGGVFKIPQGRRVLAVNSLDEEGEYACSELDDVGSNSSLGEHSRVCRCYRGTSFTETRNSVSTVTEHTSTTERDRGNMDVIQNSKERRYTRESSPSSGSFRSVNSHSSGRHERYNSRSERRESRDFPRFSRASERHERSYESIYGGEPDRKRGKYDRTPRRASGKSEWDDDNWESDGTPHHESHSVTVTGRFYRSSPFPMLAAGSPDARFVSPWLGSHTPHSGRSPSPWDHTAPSPVPIRASGVSRKASDTSQRRRSRQLNCTADSTHSQVTCFDTNSTTDDGRHELTESMRLEMDYNADRAWYDREEGSTMVDADSSSLFLGDEASFQKKEAELIKRLVCVEVLK